MNKFKTKQLLLALATTTAIIVPITAVVACGTTDDGDATTTTVDTTTTVGGNSLVKVSDTEYTLTFPVGTTVIFRSTVQALFTFNPISAVTMTWDKDEPTNLNTVAGEYVLTIKPTGAKTIIVNVTVTAAA